MQCFKSINAVFVTLAVGSVIASSAAADFWAGDGGGPRVIKKYNTDGTYAGIAINTGLNDVRKLGYYDGYVYAVDVSAGTVKRWSNTDGALDSDWSISADQPFAIAFDSSGKLYLSVLGSRNQVLRYDRETAAPDGWMTSGYEIYQPGEIAFDAASKMYLADGPRNIIERFNADGSFDTIFAQYHDLNNPTALTFDSAGRLYTASWGNSSIQRWAADGTYDGTLAGYTGYVNQIAFQGDKLIAKYVAYGTFGAVPGEIADGAIPGTWYGTADSIENWAWSRQGMAVVTSVPEPSAVTALLAGLAGLGGIIRRKK